MWTSLFKGLGASPASININEVYSALQTKIVEGQENPLSLIDLFKFYEVQKYVSYTNHMWDGFWTLINGRAWAANFSSNVNTLTETGDHDAVLYSVKVALWSEL